MPVPKTEADQVLSEFWRAYVESGRGGFSYALRHPAAAARALRAIQRLPSVYPPEQSATAGGRELARVIHQTGPLNLPARWWGFAAFPIPSELSAALARPEAKRLRYNLRLADAADITCRLVHSDERMGLLERARHRERNHGDPVYRVADPRNDDLLDHDLWVVAQDCNGEPLTLAVIAVDGEFAVLRYFRTLGAGDDHSLSRYPAHWALVEVLAANGVRWLLDPNPPAAQTNGVRLFQRILGFRHVRIRRPRRLASDSQQERDGMDDADKGRFVRRCRSVLSKTVDPIVPILPSRVANLLHTRLGDWDDYYRVAENQLSEQWDDVIWPAIGDFDFATTLELSPGGGRNTVRLCELADRLIVVDYNSDPLERTRRRLGTAQGKCQICYQKNNGYELPMVPNESVTAIYCWDAAVHFDKDVLGSYIGEFARILRPGGSGFLHHSTLGSRAHKNINQNPDWRSNVTREFVAEQCRANGLTVIAQRDVPWKWSMERRFPHSTVDCVTTFRKEA